MAKDTLYFRHDFNALSDPKIVKIRMNFGMEGYGVYFATLEILRAQDSCMQSLSELNANAFQMNFDSSKYAAIIKFCIDEKLFESDGSSYWSIRLCEDFFEMKEKSKQASNSARSRWEKKRNANALNPQSKGNAKENSIGEESIGEKSNSKPELGNPTPESVTSSFKKRCNLFIKVFNETRVIGGKPSKFKLNDKIEKSLKARLESYSPEEIIKALKIALSDPYHTENNWKHITPEFILRVDKLDKFLNQVNGTPVAAQQKAVYTGPVRNTINHAK